MSQFDGFLVNRNILVPTTDDEVLQVFERYGNQIVTNSLFMLYTIYRSRGATLEKAYEDVLLEYIRIQGHVEEEEENGL